MRQIEGGRALPLILLDTGDSQSEGAGRFRVCGLVSILTKNDDETENLVISCRPVRFLAIFCIGWADVK